MSDSRRRSSRSSSSTNPTTTTTSSSSSSHRRSSRHGGSAPSNRSSTSLHRISGSSAGRSRESLVPPPPPPTTPSAAHQSSSLQPPASDPGPGGGIYGSLAARASESRFSLTDQFASTRSVLDFGFDDGASSIFDAQSIFSVGSTARAPSLRGSIIADGPEMAGVLGAPWEQAEEEYLGGAYSTVLEANEDGDDDDDTATIGGGRDHDDDDDDNRLDDEDDDGTPKRTRAASSAAVTVIGGGGGGSSSERSPPHADPLELQDPLRFPAPVPAPPPPRHSYSYAAPPVRAVAAPVRRTYYDVFCLARDQHPPPSAAQVRAAYYRLFHLLNSSTSHGGGGGDTSGGTNLMPAALRPYAAAYFAEIQNAFETLVDPIRRLEYDRYLDDLEDDAPTSEDDDSDSDGDGEVQEDKESSAAAAPRFPPPQAAAPSFVRRYDFQTTTDMGARYAVAGARGGHGSGAGLSLAPLDYALAQTVRVGLPALRQRTESGLAQLQRRVHRARRLLRDRYGIGGGGTGSSDAKSRDGGRAARRRSSVHADQALPWPVRCGIPVVSLSASTYALSATDPDMLVLPPLADRYQPLLPDAVGPARLAQLARTRASGRVALGYRQEFWAAAPPTTTTPTTPIVAEVEAEVLPRLAVTARAARAVALPAAAQKLERDLLLLLGRPPTTNSSSGSDEPVHVEVMVQSGESSSLLSGLSSASSPSLPRLGLGLSRRVGSGGSGSIFLCADSGNAWWGQRAASPSSSSSLSSLLSPLIPPMVEVGYSLGPHALGLHAGRPLTGPADRGLKGADLDMDALGGVAAYSGAGRRGPVRPHATWTVSAAAAGGGSLAAYLRYGRTVFLTPLGRRPPASTTTTSTTAARRKRQRQAPRRAVRVEAELCAADYRLAADGYLAVRALAPVRWWGFRSGGWAAPTGFRSSTPASATPPKLGLEVALSAGSGSVHVSLYWSRLGQRLKVPFLLLPGPASCESVSLRGAAQLVFWAAVVPAAAMALREVARAYWRAAARRWGKKKNAGADGEAEADEADFIFDEEEERAITRHRAEADELTMVLASAADAQRVLARRLRDVSRDSNSTGADELVILSAKYGVALADDPDDSDGGGGHSRKASYGGSGGLASNEPPVTAMASRNGWVPDYEVADVTAAVSALVDGGGGSGDRLLIPRGLRKSRLLGFWDPAPGYRQKQRQRRQRARGKKVLHVRYLWRGQERIAEVGDRDELRLP